MDGEFVKSVKALASAFILAHLIAACDATPEDTVEPTEDSTASPEKVATEDETATFEGTEQPKTLEERRALREQLADWQGRKLPDPDSPLEDQTNFTTGEAPNELLEKIINDLVSKTAAARGDIEVMHTESLTWNDGSLGCGKPGQVYTQATVPGYRVILSHAGQQFDYRATEKGYFMLCEQPTLAAPGASSDPPAQ